MSQILAKPFLSAVDGENNPVEFDVAYPIRGDLLESMAQIRALHGTDLYLLPLSGMSSGGGILQVSKPVGGCVVGLYLEAPAKPRVRCAEIASLEQMDLDEIIIDQSRCEVCAGASITLDQLNRALAEELGSRYRVLGADLTSYAYAAVGATFMTGGMGPQRRYFSDSVIEVAMYDGDKLSCISGEPLRGLAGSYGWCGLVTAVRCRYSELPLNEIAFAIPINQTPGELARLLEHLSPFTQLVADLVKVESVAGNTDLLLGLEHVTSASMGPLFDDAVDSSIIRRGRQLVEKCSLAAADGLIFVNGYSDRSVDEFLFLLVDDAEADELTIAGISLEHTEVFNDPEQMRELREAIPYAARRRSPDARFVLKKHTDANIRLNPESVGESMTLLWQANCHFVNRVEQYFQANDGIDGQILVYGHLNPYGVDPHNRITLACDDVEIFERAKLFVVAAREEFYRALRKICDDTGSVFVGGEKGAGSERGIFAAFGGPENAPEELRDKFHRQREAISEASVQFNWRASAPYV